MPMEDLLSKIMDNIATIDELNKRNDGETMQVVIDNLWALVKSERQKLWIQSVMEVK